MPRIFLNSFQDFAILHFWGNEMHQPVCTALLVLERVSFSLGRIGHLTASIHCFIQAIVALKKGAHLLKCGKRGKPKFCAFRLSSVSNFSDLCFYQ